MITAYGYNQQVLSDLSLIDNNSNNFYNYQGLNFLSKLKTKNNKLLIMFHGHIGSKLYNDTRPKPLIERVIFRGYDYDIENIDLVCVSDYLLTIYDKYIVNWTLSTKKYNVEHIYLNLFNYIINNSKKYESVLFSGTSAGGYPSIKFACKFHKNAWVGNAQLYLEDYIPFHRHLKDMVKKDGDELLYQEKEIEKILSNKAKKIIIYTNKLDYTNAHSLKLKAFSEKNHIEFLDFRFFDNNQVLPEGKNQHQIPFPIHDARKLIPKIFMELN